ncbi:protein-cysteine N-palmitoyltransferase HHAT-like isoform X2 [Stegodyphus dumicola]|uniref:protein-cysteine N-palmitoyltransferase HHAT-like isoform X2 n=1 Tax=Stegodyphus dumicola TaxID=202533 RepID=UPI0015A9D929|nr:protein-cysteine N-palmitoyltransferase HHAT-like isoform X2 [Stegodyphus dumicola]
MLHPGTDVSPCLTLATLLHEPWLLFHHLHFCRMKVKLERIIYWAVWTSSVLWSLLKFVKSSKEYFYALNPDDFQNGWQILQGEKKDNSDVEWSIISDTFKRYWIILMFQIFCTQFILRMHRNGVPFFYAFYSMLCLVAIIGTQATTVFLSYIAIMFVAHISGRKGLCYLLTLLALVLLHNPYFQDAKASLTKGETQSFLFEVGLAWMMAKCLSFAVDRIEDDNHKNVTAMDVATTLSYCLYLPAVFTGPIFRYSQFLKEVFESERSQPGIILRNVLRVFYVLLWYFIYEILLHFVYSSAVQYFPEVAFNFDSWSLCGLGYTLPMMFYLKYFIIYGMAGSIARLEGFNFPPAPKCISCIHLSSYLWRHFDRGLYLWILRYIYHPLVNKQRTIFRRVYALVLSFTFVSVWHGMDKPVCVWSTLNFLLVFSEVLMQYTLSTRAGRYFEVR